MRSGVKVGPRQHANTAWRHSLASRSREAKLGPAGADFLQPMHVQLLQWP